MKDLIERLEQASEGSRELDKEIALALKTYCPPGRGDPTGDWPFYTTLFDAAVTLIPEEWRVTHAWWHPGSATFNLSKDVGIYTGGSSTMPALALCIAALRAREVKA